MDTNSLILINGEIKMDLLNTVRIISNLLAVVNINEQVHTIKKEASDLVALFNTQHQENIKKQEEKK